MSNVTLSELVVRNTDGSVDLDGSCDKFRGALQSFIAATADQTSKIAAGVESVFDEHKGERLPMPVLCSFTLRNLGTEASEYTVMNKLVHDYVAGNKALYEVKKGKGGGVARISDLPAPAATDSK